MLAVWRNPEFVRHARAELRPVRLVTVGVVVGLLTLLLALGDWSGNDEKIDHDLWNLFFFFQLGAQAVLLSAWSMFGCSTAIAGERAMKTYDFVRTTRLTAAEIAVGKLFGTPVLGWCAVLLAMLWTLPAGLAAGYGLFAILGCYLVIFSLAIVLGLLALLVSMTMEKPNPGTGLALLFVLSIVGMGLSSVEASFPSVAAFSPHVAILSLLGVHAPDIPLPTVFGISVSPLLMTLFLYASISAWLMAVLMRNLKREPEDMQFFSNRQAVGFAAFINLLFFAFFTPNGGGNYYDFRLSGSDQLVAAALLVDFCLLYFVGVSTLVSRERLRVWWTSPKRRLWAANAPQWPFVAVTAAALYCFLMLYALPMRSVLQYQHWPWVAIPVALFVILVFAVRDTLFLQWCNLTRMKGPVTKGFLFLTLYYFTVFMVAGTLASVATPERSDALLMRIFSLFTPFRAISGLDWPLHTMRYMLAGCALQVVPIWLTGRAIARKLSRPVGEPAKPAAAAPAPASS